MAWRIRRKWWGHSNVQSRAQPVTPEAALTPFKLPTRYCGWWAAPADLRITNSLRLRAVGPHAPHLFIGRPGDSYRSRTHVSETASGNSGHSERARSADAGRESTTDRKSTRLNSSHLGISYAV